MPTGIYTRIKKRGGWKLSKKTKIKMSIAKRKAYPKYAWKKGHLPWNKDLKGYKSGGSHYNWKGGITPLVYQIRNSFKTRQWRSDIFQRDDYTCQICGLKGVYLEVDHYPKLFSEIFKDNKIKSLEEALRCEEFWNLNGGRTLCKECHNLTKGYKGKK